MSKHVLFLLNTRRRKIDKQVYDLRCQLVCNKSIRIGIEQKLRGLKVAMGKANRELDFEMVGDLQFTINLFRAELSRQLSNRKCIVESLETFGKDLLATNHRIQEELKDVTQA